MRTVRASILVAVILLAALAASCPANPAWQANGVAVGSAPDTQETPCIVSLGTQGAIVFWADRRGGNFDIYAQKLNASGQPVWDAGGVVVCSAAYDQQFPAAVSDGEGGAIVVWQDGRLGDDGVDIYAQRLDSTGAALWQANGVPLFAHTPGDLNPPIAFSHVLTADGAGGAIVAWRDNRTDLALGNTEIYAQKIDATGAVQWIVNGVKIVGFGSGQSWATRTPNIASDGAGGAVILWQDGRNLATSGNDLYAQRVSSVGAVQWATNGVVVCNAASEQGYADIIEYPGGHTIAVWEDKRAGHYDIYAQRLDASGAAQWGANGRLVVSVPFDQRTPRLSADGLGGIVVAWSDSRNENSKPDVYAQRLDSSGVPQWAPQDVAVCTAVGWQGRVRLAHGDSGATIVTWTDNRGDPSNATYYYDIYAQMLDTQGSQQWEPNGTAVSVAPGTQRLQQTVPDGAGGAYVVWEDNRNAGDWDVYAQRMVPSPPLIALEDIAAAQAVPDGSYVSLPPRVVTAVFDGSFYIEEKDRSAGIKVLWPQIVNEGDMVAVTGVLRTFSERCIEAEAVAPGGP